MILQMLGGKHLYCLHLNIFCIKVYIEETNPSWKGAYCGSHTDPHMRTFDGK